MWKQDLEALLKAWPIGLCAWQIEGEDGQVYTLRW